jgi:putative transposase
MPWSLQRFQAGRDLHFVTFSCYRRQALLNAPRARRTFELVLERVRRKHRFYISGYVVMPEHVHLLLSEPEVGKLSATIQVIKQLVSRELGSVGQPFWQRRYYDFNVWTEAKRVEKLRYIHRNPVNRGLVQRPEDYAWSSFRHWATGEECVVEIESQWTARKREQNGIHLQVSRCSEHPNPSLRGRSILEPVFHLYGQLSWVGPVGAAEGVAVVDQVAAVEEVEPAELDGDELAQVLAHGQIKGGV